MLERKMIDLEEGWEIIQRGIAKKKDFLEGVPKEIQLSADEYMTIYDTVYKMCTQKPPHSYEQQLYGRYMESLTEYIYSTVLPPLREKKDEFFLRELVKRWTNYQAMVRWLSGLLSYLDRCFVRLKSLRSFNEVGLLSFHQLVYEEIKVKLRNAVIILIDQERDGEEIDRALLKYILDIFVQIGSGNLKFYVNDFEAAMLEDTASYYSRKASNWIQEDSCSDYMLKSEECLKREEDRVSHYLHSRSKRKLLNIVQHELLDVYASQLLKNENSGCHALLRDGKVDDLLRMNTLFSKIPHGLDFVSQVFKQHVTMEGMALVKQAKDASSNKKENDVIRMQEQVFVKNITKLHDKYLAYVRGCFLDHLLFHKALKEAFEVICSQGVGGSSSAAMLAALYDNRSERGGSENHLSE